jgi:glycosyltransferase involved in cell wall biosynthesis
MSWRLLIDPPPLSTPWAIHDLTRLIGARKRPIGSGVDRIDLAVAEALAERHGARCLFVAATVGGATLAPPHLARRLLDSLRSRWSGGTTPDPGPGGADFVRALAAGRARLALGALKPALAEGATYVNAGHTGLPATRGGLARIDPGGAAARLIYVHDLIPLEYPEYQTPASRHRFAAFMREAFAHPAQALTNSEDTARRLAERAPAEGWRVAGIRATVPRIASGPPVAPTVLRPEVTAILRGGRPWFMALGTIEPRKNHLLLLHLWRAMAEGPERPPLLVVAGRRGWENEMVLDMLDRCAAIRPHVREFGDLDDGEAAALVGGARALLMPSFAEGLGVPVMEAAALGATVIASDLPALREAAAGARAIFLDPLAVSYTHLTLPTKA